MARLAEMCAAVFVLSTVSAFGVGCTAASDEAARFREALPVQEEVALRVPSSAGGTGKTSQGLHVATTDTQSEVAHYYKLTRDMTGAVDFTTAIVLGGIWAIVHTTPTSIESKKLVWGPGAASALEPAVWRLTANEIGDSEYDYVLEGQPKEGGAWLAVLTGHGYGSARPEHKQGWFRFDNDSYKKLEQSRAHDEGSAKVTYDLRQLPATIAVELRPPTGKGWGDLVVTHDIGGAGAVSIKGLIDIDPLKTTKLEDLEIATRWASNGAGRADAVLKSGDLPFTVGATECWSTSFARVFYKDTVNFEPETGDAKTCAFSAAKP